MKKHALLHKLVLLGIGAFMALTSMGQQFPYSLNLWSNPEFIERFKGSYGFLSEREPKITTEESEMFQEVGNLLNLEQAEAALKLLRDSKDPSSSPAIDYTIGNILLQNGRIEEAREAYREAISRFPNFLRAYKNLGLSLIQEGVFAEGIASIAKAIELGAADGDAYGLLGYAYLNSQQYASAQNAYRMATIMDPDNLDWNVGMAEAFRMAGQFDDAIPVFYELAQENPDKSQYMVALANCYIARMEYETASYYLEILKRQGQADKRALVLLGDIYVSMELYKLALDSYTQGLAQSGSIEVEQFRRLADAFIQRRAFDEAADLLEFAEARASSADTALQLELNNLRAIVALDTGEFAKAVSYLETVLEIDPFNGSALLLLASHYAGRGDNRAQASYYFDLAIRNESVKRDALVQYAQFLVRSQAYEKALELLDQAQQITYQSTVARYMDSIERVLESKL